MYIEQKPQMGNRGWYVMDDTGYCITWCQTLWGAKRAAKKAMRPTRRIEIK